MSKPIQGLVAQILNSRELVINRGDEQGVRPGMIFEVLASQGEDIEDPETGEALGSIERSKVVVKVVQVEPKLAVARTFRSRSRNVGGMAADWGKIFEAPKYVREYDTLRTSERTWEDLDESESFVKVGDPVRQTHKYDDET